MLLKTVKVVMASITKLKREVEVATFSAVPASKAALLKKEVSVSNPGSSKNKAKQEFSKEFVRKELLYLSYLFLLQHLPKNPEEAKKVLLDTELDLISAQGSGDDVTTSELRYFTVFDLNAYALQGCCQRYQPSSLHFELVGGE